MSADAEVASALDLALTFPSLRPPIIDRGYLLDTVESIFEAGVDCVFLEGPEEIGKTVLCAQFALRHSASCFVLFIPQFSSVADDPAQIRFDLGNQVNWYLRGTALNPDEEVAPDRFRNLLHVLQRVVRRQRTTIYFILDGVDATCAKNPSLAQFIFTTLPIGLPGFKFVLTGSVEQIPEYIRQRVKLRPHTVSPFGLNESLKFFRDLNLDEQTVQEVHRTFRGVPGRLATVRRRIEAGEEIEATLTSTDPTADLFEPEWRAVSKLNDKELTILAAIAFLPECRSLAHLARLSDCGVKELAATLQKLTFLEVSIRADRVLFVSDSYQRYARRKLASLERHVLDLAIEKLRNTPSSGEMLRLLPDYLARSNRLSELSSYFDVRTIVAATKALHSVSEVLERLTNLQRRAVQAGADGLATRCAIARPLLTETLVSEPMKARVRAAVAMGQDDVAIALANTREVDEQRLLLLATIASAQRARGIEPDVTIVDEIRKLVSTVELARLGELAMEIGAELVLVAPELSAVAIEAYARDAEDSNAFDKAIVRLSFRALRSARTESEVAAVLSQVDRLARQDTTRHYAKAVSLLFKGQEDASVVLEQIGALEKTGERIFYARQWIRANSRENAAVTVALGAAKWLLADTGYAPNATVFRDLAMPLACRSKDEESLRLLTFLEGQSEQARVRGPLVDYFRMRSLLARAKFNWYGAEALVDLEDQALAIDEIHDLGIRAACYAWLTRAVREIGLGEVIPDPAKLHDYLLGELNTAVDQLLNGSADHVDAVRGVLTAISAVDLKSAMAIAERLNTETRRDDAYELIGVRLLEDELSTGDVPKTCAAIEQLLQRIVSTSIRQSLAFEFLSWLADNADSVLKVFPGADPVKTSLQRIIDPDLRVRGLAKLCGNVERYPEAAKPLLDRVVEEWEAIEDDFLRMDAGFGAVAAMARLERDAARKLLDKVNAFMEPRQSWLDSQAAWWALIQLQARTLAALAAVGALRDADIEELNLAIQRIGSQTERVRLLARSALLISTFDRRTARKIIEGTVLPAVGELVAGGSAPTSELRRMLIEVLPAVWLVHQTAALNYSRRLEYPDRDVALSYILAYELDGRIPGEPWSSDVRRRAALSESTLQAVLRLLEEVEWDLIFSIHVERLLDALRDGQTAIRLNANQRAHALRTIREMAEKKLPDPRGIRHEGYKVLIDAQVLAVEGGNQPHWESLLDRIRSIPNISDRCFVLTKVTSLIPRRLQSLRNQCFAEAEELWRELPTYEERLLRLEAIVECCYEDFRSRVAQLIRECCSTFSPESVRSASKRFHALVEMAYKVDEEWAASMVSITDDDPARAEVKAQGKRRLKELELQRRLQSSRALQEENVPAEQLAQVCWESLGILNASKATAISWEDVGDLVARASDAKLFEATLILSYAITSVAFRYAGMPTQAEKVRSLYGAICDAARIMTQIDTDGRNSLPESASILRETQSTREIVVEPGARDHALKEIGAWLRSVKPLRFDIVDPYFRPSDVELLLLIAKQAPNCQVRILTSRRNQEDAQDVDGYREEMQKQWARLGCFVEMPPTMVYVVGRTSDGHMGIHDRWWLTEGAGIECGTSFNSLGRDKTSVVRFMWEDEVARRRAEVDPYFQLTKRSHAGERLVYTIVQV